MQTRGEQMLALRRARLAASPPFLRGGFRPFFFGGAAWAVLALLLWLAALSGAIALPSALDALAWHRHEMLFGFVGAVICGFLLTAIPNWTGRLPIAGTPLAALFGFWLAARLALLFSGVSGIAIAFVLDVGFYILLAGLFAREVASARNRNLPIVGLVLLFGRRQRARLCGRGRNTEGYGNWLSRGHNDGGPHDLARRRKDRAVFHAQLAGQAMRSRAGFRDRRPGSTSLTIAVTAAAMIAWTALPHDRFAGAILILAGILQAIRLGRWQGVRAAADPLVLILHVGYAWVPIGLALLGASILSPAVPASAAIHALTAGAMATMILAVMTRATLGHTGRELKANAPTIFLYLLVTLGAALRVAAPFGLFDYMARDRACRTCLGGSVRHFPAHLRPDVDPAAR